MRSPLPPDRVPIELIARYDTPGPRYTSYPTIPSWKGPFGPADYRHALVDLAGAESEAVSVYVRIPFCGDRCHYCASNVTLAGRPDIADDYLDRLEHELEPVTEILGRHREPVLLHLGGGTTNSLTLPQFSRLSVALGLHHGATTSEHDFSTGQAVLLLGGLGAAGGGLIGTLFGLSLPRWRQRFP